MNETIEKINGEIEEGLRKLSTLQMGTDEYECVFQSVKALEDLKEKKLKAELDSELDTRKQELAERQAAAEEIDNEKKIKASRFEQIMGIVKTGVIVVGTIIGTVITVNAEQTQVISSKGIELFSKFKNVLK